MVASISTMGAVLLTMATPGSAKVSVDGYLFMAGSAELQAEQIQVQHFDRQFGY